MRLRRNGGEQRSDQRLRIYYAADIHGSEKCWRKFVRSATFYKADVLILGGDLSGKILVPIEKHDDGTYEASWSGSHYRLQSAEELEKRIRFNGFYPYVCTPDDMEAMRTDERVVEAIFRRQVLASVQSWLAHADRELEGQSVECVVIPGNDDDWALDTVLSSASRVTNGDRRVTPIGSRHQLLNLGLSNRTPWDSPREADEDELTDILSEIESQLDPGRITIANIHVPPFGSHLDDAPALTEDLDLVSAGGERPTKPVGSHAVREWIERVEPALSLHGHIHESRGSTKIGKTLSLNPGSRYNEGVLLGALIDLDGERVVRHQFVSG